MTSSHQATINFQNSHKHDLNHHLTTSVNTQVYGNTEGVATYALRKMYSNWDNIIILKIEWKT